MYIYVLASLTVNSIVKLFITISMLYTLKQLSKQLSIPVNKILNELCIKHRKKYYYQHDLKWYEFASNNDIIITKEYAQYYAKLKEKSLIVPSSLNTVINNLPNFNDINENNYNAVDIENRLPIPTIVLLGHYNHGKTTLLDSFNQTSYAKQEPHGITQMIRTKLISLENKIGFTTIPNNHNNNNLRFNEMTFIDTPGQDVFYRMRSYGAKIADIALLLVAIDDGICIQTIESIGILDDLNIPVIVCINKIDLYPNEMIQKEMMSKLVCELKEYECLENANIIEISASKNINIDKLVDKISYVYTNMLQNNKSNTINNNNNTSSNNYNSMIEIRRILNSYYIHGIGVVLNIIKNKKYGSSLHVIIRYGEIKVGDYFSVGGWSGTIRNIMIDYTNNHDSNSITTKQHEDHTLLHNSNTNNSNKISNTKSTSSSANSNNSSSSTVKARKGHPVLIIISLHRLIDEPRPLGDFIYFHSNIPLPPMPPLNIQQQQEEKIDKGYTAAVSSLYQFPKEAAEYLMEQAQLEYRIEQAILSDDLVQKYRLNQRLNVLKHQKIGLTECEEMIFEEILSTEVVNDHDSTTSTTTTTTEDDEEDSSEYGAALYIVQSDSDIAMSTLYDAYMDMVEHVEQHHSTQKSHVISWNIGELSIKDILLAKESNAMIITYNIKIDHAVMKKAKELEIEIQSYSNIPEIVNIITNSQH